MYSYRQIESSLTHSNYIRKNIEYADAINQIMDSAEQVGLIKEAKVFCASREIWKAYDELRTGICSDFHFKYGKFETLWLIASGLKSEKWKTMLKAFIIYSSNIFAIK